MAKKKEAKLTEFQIKTMEFSFKAKLLTLLELEIIGTEVVDYIELILNEIEFHCPNILQECVNKVKDTIQKEAANIWYTYEPYCWSLLAMATGTGKSKIPINILSSVYHTVPRQDKIKVLLIVPTEKLRDENWKDEFEKWGAFHIYNTCVTRTCYASLDNFEGTEWDLVIGDEFHNITLEKEVFFSKNKVKRLICLTATPPTDPVKLQILKRLNISTSYNVPLDIAVRLKLVAPYNVTVIEGRLDDVIKNVVSGTKANPFMTTEKKAYDYKTQLVTQAMYGNMRNKAAILKFRILDRMRFIKNLESRTKNAKFILDNFIKPGERILIFCGSIAQADEVSSYSFHSKTNDKDYQEFKNKKIDELACVSALNEGQNLPDVDTVFVICIESGDKTITQQIGRGIRFAIDHNCRVIIMIITDTVDEQWFKKATINLDPSKFRYVRMANLLNGVETI